MATPNDGIQQLIRQIGASGTKGANLAKQLEDLLSQGQVAQRDYSSGQAAFFGSLADIVGTLDNRSRQASVRSELNRNQATQGDAKARLMRMALEGDSTTPSPSQGPPLAGAPQPVAPQVANGPNQALADALSGPRGPSKPSPLADALEARGPSPKKQKAMILITSGIPEAEAIGRRLLAEIDREEGDTRELAKENRGHTYQEERDERQNAASERRARILAGQTIATEQRTDQRAIDREDRADEKKREAQARDVEERFRGADKALNEMETIIRRDGTFEATGPTSAELEGLITSYATDMAKLRDSTSVARETEVEMEKKALFKPGLFTRNATALEIIKKQRQRVRERRDEAYKVRGLDAPDGEGNRPGDVRTTNADGNPVDVPAGELPAFKKARLEELRRKRAAGALK